MKNNKFICIFLTVSVLLSYFTGLTAFALNTVESTLTFYNSELDISDASDAAYVSGSAEIISSGDFSSGKYIIASYKKTDGLKLIGLKSADFILNGGVYTATLTDKLDVSEAEFIKEFYLDGATLKPITSPVSTKINASYPTQAPTATPIPSDEWTIEVTWAKGDYPADATVSLYNTKIKDEANKNPQWQQFNKTLVLSQDVSTYTFENWKGQDWAMESLCFSTNESYWYIDSPSTDYESKIKYLTVYLSAPYPSSAPSADEWTLNVSWVAGAYPSDATVKIYNSNIRTMAKSSNEWSQYDKEIEFNQNTTSYSFTNWRGQDWTMRDLCFVASDELWYINCISTDETNKIKNLEVYLRGVYVTETPTPTFTPAPTSTPTAPPVGSGAISVTSGDNKTEVSSLSEAQALARAYSSSAPVYIDVNSDIKLTSPLKFTSDDCYANKVTFRGNGHTISGGKEVTSWTKVSGNIWKAPYSGDVSGFYVNDSPMTLAQCKSTWDSYGSALTRGITVDSTNGTITVPSTYIEADVSGAANARISIVIEWVEYNYGISKITKSGSDYVLTLDADSKIIQTSRASDEYAPGGGKYMQSFSIMNVYSLMNLDGEYYSDGSHIYYYTATDPNTKECFVPVSDGLVQIEGTTSALADNIEFNNFVFKCSKSDDLKDTAYVTLQANQYCIAKNLGLDYVGYTKTDKQIYVDYANHITFSNCEIYNIAGTAIEINQCAYNVTVDSCNIHDIGDAGIRVGRASMSYDDLTVPSDINTCKKVSSESSRLPANVKIINNKINNIGTEYPCSAGVLVYYAHEIDISHNTISNTAYSGISTGWGWGNSGSSSVSTAHGNITVSYNYITDTCQQSIDGGCIYNLGVAYRFNGRESGIDINNNYMTVTGKYNDNNGYMVMTGIYFDNGSQYGSAKSNVVRVSGRRFRSVLYVKALAATSEIMKVKDVVITENYTNATATTQQTAKDLSGTNVTIFGNSTGITIDNNTTAKKIIAAAGSSIQ